MSLAAPTPPLLLTKRLTTFLRANLSPQIHTALLTNVAGKVLTHASPQPLATLRTHATVAASLWALYAAPSTTAAIEGALPSHPSTLLGKPTSSAITVQLTGAIVVIRYLRCGLLFVCISPAVEPSGPAEPGHPHPPSRPLQTPQENIEPQPSPLLGSPSEADSITSAGAATTISIATTTSVSATAVTAMRRQAEELARWLSDSLKTLDIPDETVGTFEPR